MARSADEHGCARCRGAPSSPHHPYAARARPRSALAAGVGYYLAHRTLFGTNLALFAAWRAPAIPVFPVIMSVVGWVVFFLVADHARLPTLGMTVAAAAPAWCGVIVLRMRDEAWSLA